MTVKHSSIKCAILMSIAGVLLNSCKNDQLTTAQARQIAKEAYIYGFPLVMNYKTLYQYTLNQESAEYKGDFNSKGCDARLFTPSDKAVVTPNSDTPYCMFWRDIRKEPIVITIPEIEDNRYFSFQLIDLYTHNFAYIGTLTTGNQQGTYLIAQQGWNGEKPEGISEIINCETGLFFCVVRTQLLNDSDLENIKAIQERYQIKPLSQYLGNETVHEVGIGDFPEWIEGAQFTEAAFEYIDFMLILTQPVPEEEQMRAGFAKLNIGTSTPFNINDFDEDLQKAIKEGVKEGFAEIEAFIKKNASDPLASAKIFGTRDFLTKSARENYNLDNFYLLRAGAAQTGLYGNSGFEAMYPTYFTDDQGNPLNAAENKYTLTFDENSLPPVRAFWSLTMYDGKTQLLIDNPINRYLLNSNMVSDFIKNEDGSTTLYIQKESPGKELEANWLPAPDGPFYCVLRLYGPKEEALNGSWKNPLIVKETI